MPKAVHLTSVHPTSDNRIRHKECATLAAAGWDVVLVACSSEGSVATTGVRVRVVEPVQGRALRMTLGAFRVYRAALAEGADVYHIHDPELLPWAVLLRLGGNRVVYDVHEDVAATVAYKSYLPRPMRSLIALGVAFGERAAARWLSAIVAATPYIGRSVAMFGPPVVVVQNFPRLDEVESEADPRPYANRPPNVVYAGGIARVRGIGEIVDAMARSTVPPHATLHLAGRWMPSALRKEIMEQPGWGRVIDHGLLNRRALMALLADCRVGMVTMWPERNYLNAYATKMFEYMAMGLPVVASDFPLWRRIVEGAGCGLLVDPTDAEAIAQAIGWLLENPVEAEAMGERGRVAVQERYNWENEAGKLLSLYDALLGDRGSQAGIEAT